jgi:hypothetical protein
MCTYVYIWLYLLVGLLLCFYSSALLRNQKGAVLVCYGQTQIFREMLINLKLSVLMTSGSGAGGTVKQYLYIRKKGSGYGTYVHGRKMLIFETYLTIASASAVKYLL